MSIKPIFDDAGRPILLANFGVPLFYLSGDEDSHGYIKGQSGRNLVKWMFSESGFATSMVDWRMLKTIFIKRDEKVFDDFRDALQEVLHNAYLHGTNDRNEHSHHFIKNKNLQIQNIVSTILSAIPLTEPTDHSSIIIPQFIDDCWQQISYQIERIRMTPIPFSTPYFAYGLKPKVDQTGKIPTGVQAHVLFMGTNPMPTATGTHHTIMNDTMPGFSVGEHLYLSGKKKIQEFINNAQALTQLPVIATGQSLGGSLAVLAHVYQPDKVQAIAINPPAWLSNMRSTYTEKLAAAKSAHGLDAKVPDQEFLSLVHQKREPITIFSNKGDPVFLVGNYIPEHAKIWQISSKVGDNSSYMATHKDCFGAHSATKDLKFKALSPQAENNKFMRNVVTVLWQIISVPLMAMHITIMLIKAIIHFTIVAIERFINLLPGSTVKKTIHHARTVSQNLESTPMPESMTHVTQSTVEGDVENQNPDLPSQEPKHH